MQISSLPARVLGRATSEGLGGATRAAVVAALVVAGAALPVRAQAVPNGADLSPVDLDLVRPLVQSGRWVWLGDSFSIPSPARVSFATLSTWPLGRIGAVAVGTRSWLLRFEPAPPQGKEITADQGYLVARGTPEERPMGLPVFTLAEWALGTGTTSLGDAVARLDLLMDGYAGSRGGALVDATVRPILYGHAGAAARGTLVLGGAPSALPEAGFALGTAGPLTSPFVPLRADVTVPGLVHYAGTVVAGQPGHYAQFLADASWSYRGFAADAPPDPPNYVKQFRTAELADYLAATTLDPDQPAVAVVYLAQEAHPVERTQAILTRGVERVRAAFEMAGLAEPVVLLLHPHAIESNVVDTPEENERAGVAMREIALADPGVAFFSLYDATAGVVFDGRPDARLWLQSAGLETLSYGAHVEGDLGPIRLLDDYGANFLDASTLHPTPVGAAFFSAILHEGITGQPVHREGSPSAPDSDPLSPNPARPGRLVTGAPAGATVYDVRGRLVGRADRNGAFAAPAAAGVYVVGGSRLVVQ